MKKIFSILAVIGMISAFSFSCYAASHTLDAPGSKDIPVNVSVSSNDGPNLYTPQPEGDGGFRVTTDSGVEISIVPQDDGDDTEPSFSVYEIPEDDTEAIEWLDDCTDDVADQRYYFCIVEDQEMPSSELSVDVPDEFGNVIVAKINEDGSLTPLDSSVEGGKVTFSIDEGGIYAIMSEAGSGDPSSPTSDYLVVSITMALAAIAFLLIVAKKAKKEARA